MAGGAPSCANANGPTSPCEKAGPALQIQQLWVAQASMVAPGYPPDSDCQRFTLTQAQALRYFQAARPISANDRQHVVDDSQCLSRGRLKLRNGRSFTWQIGEQAEAWLEPDGQRDRSKHRQHLFCSRCTFAPFSP